jgi:hypothetical protein
LWLAGEMLSRGNLYGYAVCNNCSWTKAFIPHASGSNSFTFPIYARDVAVTAQGQSITVQNAITYLYSVSGGERLVKISGGTI